MSAYSTRTEHLATGQNLDRWITSLHQAASARSSQPLPPPHEWVRDYWPGRNIFVNDIEAVLLRGTPISDDDLRSLIDTLNDIAFIYRIKPTSPAAIRKGQIRQAQKQTNPITITKTPRAKSTVKLNGDRLKYHVYVVLSKNMVSLMSTLGYSQAAYSNWVAQGKCPAHIPDALGITAEQLATKLEPSEALELQQAAKVIHAQCRTRRAQADLQAAA